MNGTKRVVLRIEALELTSRTNLVTNTKFRRTPQPYDTSHIPRTPAPSLLQR